MSVNLSWVPLHRHWHHFSHRYSIHNLLQYMLVCPCLLIGACNILYLEKFAFINFLKWMDGRQMQYNFKCYYFLSNLSDCNFSFKYKICENDVKYFTQVWIQKLFDITLKWKITISRRMRKSLAKVWLC